MSKIEEVKPGFYIERWVDIQKYGFDLTEIDATLGQIVAVLPNQDKISFNMRDGVVEVMLHSRHISDLLLRPVASNVLKLEILDRRTNALVEEKE